MQNFWHELPRPIIGLSPMDGVTDAAYRFIMAKYGGPKPVFTEFTSVEGIRAGATRLLDDFLYSEIERPVIAQLFGADPNAFYGGAIAACALGFDGIDINMGCPAKNVTQHGAGAALILDPPRAQEIVSRTKAGISDWVNGINLQDSGLPEAIVTAISGRNPLSARSILPVSIKTRLGFDSIIILEWVKKLLEVEPVAITLHGRTLKQGYSGLANWEAIGEAADYIHKNSNTLVLGNGDVASFDDAHYKSKTYRLDGVLIGRASYGNPWLFKNDSADFQTRKTVALEHARFFSTTFDPRAFVRMHKHLLDYFKGFEGAREMRQALMRVENLSEVEAILR